MNLEAYDAIAAAGGIPKPQSKRPRKGISRPNQVLKIYPEGIDLKVKIETIRIKGNRCFCGQCEVCGGTAIVTLEDDFHHFPHKGSHSTPDDPKYLWPAKRDCHDYYQTHPREERTLFKRIEVAGIEVFWTVPKKEVEKSNRKT